MHAKLYIPKRMSLGQQDRPGTFTGRIGFLNPHDEKDRPKFKASWENWRDKKIPVEILDNEPKEGFVLNKNAGGRSSGWYWDSGREAKIRVWDPAGFEIEITIPNMLWLLEQTNSFKGKGLEGKMVYAMNGSQLMLIPVDSEEYRGSMDFTDLKYKKVSSKELTEGATVFTKDQETLIYIGKYEIVKRAYGWSDKTFSVAKEMIFYNPKGKDYRHMKADKIARIEDTEITNDFADLVEKFEKKNLSFATKKLEIVSAPEIKTKTHSSRRSKAPAEEEITDAMIFVQDVDIYKGYRVFQKNKQKFRKVGSGKDAWQFPDGWEAEKILRVTNPFNVKIEDGINTILPGKDPEQQMELKEINKLNTVQFRSFIPDINGRNTDKRKLG